MSIEIQDYILVGNDPAYVSYAGRESWTLLCNASWTRWSTVVMRHAESWTYP